MAADNVPAQNLECVDRLNAGAYPVANIGAGTNSLITVLYHRKNIVRIPHLVVWVIVLLRMIVEGDHYVELLHKRLEGIDRIDGLGSDGPQAKRFGKLKELASGAGIL